MKWAPEDRMNKFAEHLLAEQPDPPRQVSVPDVLRTYAYLLGFLPLAVFFLVGGFLIHQPLGVALLVSAVLAIAVAVLAQQTADARNALRFGIATTGQVTAVSPTIRGGKLVTLRVNAVETTVARTGGSNVLVEGDVVQVMVDPQTHQVLLVLGLRKPSPLYAPPPA